MNLNLNRYASLLREYLVLQGMGGLLGGTSAIGIGVSDELLKKELKPVDPDKIIAIAQKRLRSEQSYLITTVIDEPNFLSLSLFLQSGAKQSLAVCRIARHFSLEAFKEFIQNTQNEVKKRGGISHFNSVEKIKEIFSIPDEVAANIEGFEEGKDFLEVLKNHFTENHLSKMNPVPIGTGFLVGSTHLLTNHHVIQNAEVAEQCIAQFDYIKDEQGNVQASKDYQFASADLFITEPNFDYTLVKLKSGILIRQAGYNFGWIQLVEDDEMICPGGLFYIQNNQDKSRDQKDPILEISTTELQELQSLGYKFKLDKIKSKSVVIIEASKDEKITAKQKLSTLIQRWQNSALELKEKIGDQVIIVQHPKGNYKQIALNDKVIDYGLYDVVVRYKTDSDYGSSGSPVFNSNWDLVALHHAAVRNEVAVTEQQLQQIQGNQKKESKVVAQQGIRICRIVENLKEKSFNDSKLRSFIQDFVITSEQLNYPPLPSGLEFDGVKDYLLLKDFGFSPQSRGNNDESTKYVDSFSIEAWICPYSNEVENTIVSKFYHSSYDGSPASLGYDSLRIYITKEGKIVFSRCMHRLPTLPLELPKDEQEKQEVIFNLSNILKNLYGEDGELYFKDNPSSHDNPLDRATVKQLREPIVARTYTRNDANFAQKYPQIADTLNSNITYLGFSKLNYNLGSSEQNAIEVKAEKNPSQGKIVFGLQNILKILGYQVEPSGCFDLATRNAVIAFQQKYELQKDGVAGPLTQRALSEIQSYEFETNLVVKFGEFNHIVVTYDNQEQAEKQIKIYLNGKLCGQLRQETFKPIAREYKKQSIKATRNIDITEVSPIIVGAYSNKNLAVPSLPLEGRLLNLFRGAIAEVRIWGKARQEADIQANMHRRINGNEPNLIGYWRFEEGEDNQTDQTENEQQYKATYNFASNSQGFQENPSQIFGAKYLRQSTFPSPPLPFGLKFDGEDDYVDCDRNPNIEVTEGITIEAWVKHIYGDGLIVGRGGEEENGYSLSWTGDRIRIVLQNTHILYREASGLLPKTAQAVQRAVDSNKTLKTIVDTQDPAPTDGVWHHIAFTWGKTLTEDGTPQESHEIQIYIDGRRQNSVVIEGQSKSIVVGGQYQTVGLFNELIGKPSQNLSIGGRKKDKTDKGIYFNGCIAEVRLWKVARTQSEIKANMYRRLNCNKKELIKSKDKGLVGYWRLDDGCQDQIVLNLASESEQNYGTIHGAIWFPNFENSQLS